MCYIEQTGVRGYDKPIYSIQELNAKQLQIIIEGIEIMRAQIANSASPEKLSYLEDCIKLQNALKVK